jgi:hypothetical protein
MKNALYSPLAIDGLTGFEGARGVLSALLGFKHGGRVRGVGKATHGHGKAMKKQGKK